MITELPQAVFDMAGFPTTSTTATTSTATTVRPIPTIFPGRPEYQTASDTGFSTLWVVFAIMVAASAIFAGLSWNVPVSRRLYYVVTTLITIIAALSYFSMATGQAKWLHCTYVNYDHRSGLPVDITTADHSSRHNDHETVCREVYWARYVDWALTTPLLLLDLCLLAGVDGAHTIMAILADVIMILSGLFAALGRNDVGLQKWGWYAIACVSYLFVIWHVALHGATTVRNRGAKAVRLFGSLAIFTFVIWTAYPIVWGIADGARKATVDTEILVYGILDVLAKVGFGLWLLLAHRATPETNIELPGWWSNGVGSSEGRIRIGDDEGH